MKKGKLLALLLSGILLFAVGCAKEDAKTGSETKSGEEEVIRFGVTPEPHGQIAELIAEDLEKEGVKLEIVTFDDYQIINKALDSKEIDADFFQHQPYFEDQISKNGYELVSLGFVHIEPMALYSDKVKSVDELGEGAKIIIPNDSTNGGRALLLLSSKGLIQLDDDTNVNVTEANITENPKNFEFVAMDAAAIPRTYKDADAAVINSNWALQAGLQPTEDGLIMEESDAPYANLVAVRKGEEKEEKYTKLMNALRSEKVKKFIEEKYEGAVVPAF